MPSHTKSPRSSMVAPAAAAALSPSGVGGAATASVDQVDLGIDTDESEWELDEVDKQQHRRRGVAAGLTMSMASTSSSGRERQMGRGGGSRQEEEQQGKGAGGDVSSRRTIRLGDDDDDHDDGSGTSSSGGSSGTSHQAPSRSPSATLPLPLATRRPAPTSIAMAPSTSMSSSVGSGRSYDPWADSSDAELGESSAGEEDDDGEEDDEQREEVLRDDGDDERAGAIGGWPAAFRPRPTHAYTPSSESTRIMRPPPPAPQRTGGGHPPPPRPAAGDRRLSPPSSGGGVGRPKANGYTADLKDKRYGAAAAAAQAPGPPNKRSRSPRRVSEGGGAKSSSGGRVAALVRTVIRPIRTPRRAALFLVVIVAFVVLSAVSRSEAPGARGLGLAARRDGGARRREQAVEAQAAIATTTDLPPAVSKPSKAGRWTESPPRGGLTAAPSPSSSSRLAPRWVLADWAEKSWRAAKDTVARQLPSRGGLGGAGVWRLRSDLNAKRDPGHGTHEREIQRIWLEGPQAADQCRFVSPVEAYHQALRRLKDRSAKIHAGQGSAASSSSSPPVGRSRHVFSPTGHLIVDESPDARHPIPQLLELGEKRWEEMLERQSTTLGEAVQEYRKRYGREPPKGFDVWWDFAMTHDLVLPDEYDRIHLDLAPFWALPRDEMRRRAQEVESIKETYTLVVKGGRVDVEISDESGLAWEGTRLRAADQASLVKSFARYLPDMRAVFSIHDHPQVYVSWARRSSLVELGLSGQHTKHLRESDNADVLWSRSCAPESNLRRNTTNDESHSLVYDSLEAADICANPYLLDLHGLTVEKHGPASHPRPHTSLLPLFSLAKTSVNSDILITPLDQFGNGAGEDPAWEDKRDSRLVWRGSTTGISWMDKTTPWRKSHRTRLHTFAQNRSQELLDVIVPEVSEDGLAARHRQYPVSDVAEAFYDMRLAGEPLQCNKTDGTCDDMKREIDFAAFQTPDELNQYKFLFDVDGNGWSGRFRRLMSTNSVVLKAGIFTEWFQPHLIPWFMYIPTRLDYSDLPMILSFLRGPPDDPDAGFDEVAKALAVNGKCFVNRMFRVQDLQAYMFRLFLEYARLIAPEGQDMDFHYELEYENEDAEEEMDVALVETTTTMVTTTTRPKREWAIETQRWGKARGGQHVIT